VDNSRCPLFGNRETGDRYRRWRSLVLAILHVELGAMEWADEQCSPKPTQRELRITVRTVVLQRMETASYSAHDHAVRTKLWEGAHLTIAQAAEVTKVY
jgi:hypothetical protein